jgi:hypothetical protein
MSGIFAQEQNKSKDKMAKTTGKSDENWVNYSNYECVRSTNDRHAITPKYVDVERERERERESEERRKEEFDRGKSERDEQAKANIKMNIERDAEQFATIERQTNDRRD